MDNRLTGEKIYFRNLDSIRFFAALMVFIAHGISPSYTFLDIKDTLVEKILKTISSGGAGVSIFFVLSGFLITYLLLTEKAAFGRIDIKKFYVRRVLRIWPLYYTLLIFTFFIYPYLKNLIGIETELGSNIYRHLFFLSNFDVINILQHCYGSDAMSQNITWSVSVEEQFYVFWPLLIAFVPNRFLGQAILAVVLLSIGFRINNRNNEFVLYYHTISVFVNLAVGGLASFVIFTKDNVRNFFLRLTPGHHLGLLITCFIWLFVKHNYLDVFFGDSLTNVLSALIFSIVIASQCFAGQNSAFSLSKIKFANFWGKYTYGIYMLHPVALLFANILSRKLHIERQGFFSSISFGLLGLALTFVFSYLSYELMEVRFLKLKKSFTLILNKE